MDSRSDLRETLLKKEDLDKFSSSISSSTSKTENMNSSLSLISLVSDVPSQSSVIDRMGDNSSVTLNLKDVNINIKKGSLVAIIGKIGSGKSSLLKSLLGDLYYSKNTKVSITGSMSYVS